MSSALLSPDLIVAFQAVMAQGSLPAAARQLNLSQPTVRRAIAALEADIGATLFLRSDNGLLPTARAEALRPLAEALVNLTHAFARSAATDDETPTGEVRLTASRVVAHHLLPEIAAELLSRFPGLRLQIVPDDRTGNLLRREADVAIRMQAPAQKQLVARKVRPLDLGLFAAAGFEFGDAAPETVEECLARLPFVWDDRSRFTERAARELGLAPPRHVAVATDDQVLQVALIAAGAGVGVCQAAVARALGLRRLVPDWSLPLPVWIVAHEDQITARHIRCTFDWLVSRFDAPPEHDPA